MQYRIFHTRYRNGGSLGTETSVLAVKTGNVDLSSYVT